MWDFKPWPGPAPNRPIFIVSGPPPKKIQFLQQKKILYLGGNCSGRTPKECRILGVDGGGVAVFIQKQYNAKNIDTFQSKNTAIYYIISSFLNPNFTMLKPKPKLPSHRLVHRMDL